MMATTAKYVRLSSEDDDLRKGGKLESNSIANQRDLLDAFISRMPELAAAGWLWRSCPGRTPVWQGSS